MPFDGGIYRLYDPHDKPNIHLSMPVLIVTLVCCYLKDDLQSGYAPTWGDSPLAATPPERHRNPWSFPHPDTKRKD